MTSTTCYYSNGAVDPDGHPCDVAAVQSGVASACCHANDVCWSDGSCSTNGNSIPYWMSCTDQSWNGNSIGGCPSIGCQGQQNNNGETWIVKCFPRTSMSCCLSGNNTCCEDSASKSFVYTPGAPVALLDKNGTNTLARSSASGTASGTTSPSSGPKSSSSSNKSAEIALGVVLGVVVIAALFGLTALWMKFASEKSRRQRAERELYSRGIQVPKQPDQIKYNNLSPVELPSFSPPQELSPIGRLDDVFEHTSSTVQRRA